MNIPNTNDWYNSWNYAKLCEQNNEFIKQSAG